MNEKGNHQYLVQEKEINLIDLLWKLVYSWRMLIFLGILFGLLLSGVKYVKDSRTNVVDENSAMESIRESLSEKDKLVLENAIVENEAIERQLNSNMEYQKNSFLMNMDPYNVNQIAIQYYVNTHYVADLKGIISQDYSQSLLHSYAAFVNNGQMTEELMNKLDIKDGRYISELIAVDTDLNSNNFLNSTFCVFITGKDMDQARVIADTVQKAMEEHKDVLNERIGNHDLVLVSDYEQIIQDSLLAEKQAKVESVNYNLRIQQDSLKSKLSSQQLQILDYEYREKFVDKNEAHPEVISVNPRFSIKYTLLGFIAGVFVACVAIALKYVFSPCLKNERELQEFYGVRLFGKLNGLKKSKKFLPFIDRGIDQIRGLRKDDTQDQMELMYTNVVVACKKDKIQKVVFVSSIHLNEAEKKLISKVMNQMNKEGIETVFQEDAIRNKEALVQMSDIGQVVLIEKVNQTVYYELEKELTFCNEQGASVIGAIAIE